MKFSLAVAALVCNASAYQLYDEQDLTEDLTLKLSRYWERPGWKKSEALEQALRMPRSGPREERQQMEDLNNWSKENFGWTPEEKYNEIQPEKRYWPIVQEIIKSKEAAESAEFYQNYPSNPQVRKIMKEAEWLKNDIFGGYDRSRGRWVRPSIINREIREDSQRVDRYGKERHITREQREQEEYEGIWIDNDSIKDVFEDAEDLWEDVETLLDPKSALNQQKIKVDATLRFSKPVQSLLKMVLKDFGIENMHDFRVAATKIEHAVEQGLDTCPYLARATKAAERLVRYYGKHIQVSDLPSGSRMRWVNNITSKLYNIMRSKYPVRDLYAYLKQNARDVERAVERYAETIEREEQKYNKGFGGI